MSNQDQSQSAGGAWPKGISGAGFVTVIVLSAIVLAAVYTVNQMTLPKASSEQILKTTGLARPVHNRLDERFADADGDLVADAPTDAAQQIDPEVLTFCYVPDESGASQAANWKQFMDTLAEKTGKQVEYLELATAEDQLKALKDGRLHIAGLNTGNVPIAVNAAGFVPVCSPGNAEGEVSYKMQIIVPAASAIHQVGDLKGHTIALTSAASNSGYKAPLVILRNDFGLEPERDFLFVHSGSHLSSIKGVASGEYQTAAVASDLLHSAIEGGEIQDGAVRVIYESEPFPKASVGYVYNLKPELADAIRQVLLAYTWQGTDLESRFASEGATGLVAISYKDDWALVRRIDDAIGFKHEIK